MMICTGCKCRNKQADNICEICRALKRMWELEAFQEEWRSQIKLEDNQRNAARGIV
ncbi:hypothetical protein [Hungatella hominis]|uniref:Cysteine-rich CPCC domain-containing protein n=1 Tax=Hungatella hominis TaxID=2763050 RepID=A0ABR7H4U1_9FIRM|nr:hypothetical protein [Hungatella hominis]MBC5708205.1 hypothetical protein [Hungatella hominis]